MISEISAPKDTPYSTQRVTLDGVEYVVTLQWNVRSGWFLGLADADGAEIFSPRKMVANWDLLSSITDSRRPPGALICVDLQEGSGRKPGYTSLGETHMIMYFDESEMDT